jgi:hypothetical protein
VKGVQIQVAHEAPTEMVLDFNREAEPDTRACAEGRCR